MVTKILDTAQQHTASNTPRNRFSEALEASRQLQSDGQDLGYDRVYKYYEDVDGDWLENWQEDK